MFQAKKFIFDRKNVLILGGAGFIGSHLCDDLVKTCKVICVDNFISSSIHNINHLLADPNFEFIRHDISEPIDLDKIKELQKFKIEFQGIQEIYNLACPTSVLNFKKNKINNLIANSYGVKNSLDLAIKYQAKYLFASSSVVYGPKKQENKRIEEDNIGQVDFISDRSSYDEGKRFAEACAMNYQSFYEIDVKIARIFRTYGPRMLLNDGQMIPEFITNALDNKDLTIYGDENFMSSFCYVKDMVDGLIKLMESDFQGPINLGSDREINIGEIALKIIELTQSKSQIQYADPLLFMTPLCLPDISKASNQLAWFPIITLENGLKKTIDDLAATKIITNY